MRALYIEEKLWKPPENVTSPNWKSGDHTFRSLWSATDAKGGTHLRQTAGINPIAKPRGTARCPGVAIFLTPAGERHKLPWLDEVDLDNGFLRYFGDNKPELSRTAETTPGNAALLDQLNLYSSSSDADRARAAPLLFFRNLGSDIGVPLVEFLGFGVIKEAHRVTQLFKGKSFSNYAFDCILFRGSEDGMGQEYLDVGWIDSRRDKDTVDASTLAIAPKSWRHWAEQGYESLDSAKVRRTVILRDLWPPKDQVPEQNSALGIVLDRVYTHYGDDYKHGFQALAALATEVVLGSEGIQYHRGWVTPVGPDGGVDFVQRMDLGRGFSAARLVVLGQAKCRKPWPISGNGVSAEELARVVARLRRGWIGAYVTTSFFTEPAQKELIIDEYPVTLIHGRRLAQAVEELRIAMGHRSVPDLLRWVDGVYLNMLSGARSRPSDIMRELPAG
jgi:hypothetical protein